VNRGFYGFPSIEYSVIDPDAYPEHPSPWDDEFDAGYLLPKWTVYNQQAGQTIQVADSQLVMYCPYIQKDLWAVMQPINGSWRVRTKLWQESPTQYWFGAGLCARRTTGAIKEVWAGIHKVDDIWAVSELNIRHTNNGAYASDTRLANAEYMPMYFELEFKDGILTWRVSASGYNYVDFVSEPVTGAGSFLGGDPEEVGINFYAMSRLNDGMHLCTYSFDWFRRMPDA
jgi:hypothetical protein